MLWKQDRLVYFIDRKPVSDIKVPIGFDDPMYMIVNLAMGSKYAVESDPLVTFPPFPTQWKVFLLSSRLS